MSKESRVQSLVLITVNRKGMEVVVVEAEDRRGEEETFITTTLRQEVLVPSATSKRMARQG